jgi:uncharacterized protein YjbI with pentapeptide repeats
VQDADLRDIDLRRADLGKVSFSYVKLIGSNLEFANLRDASFYEADLTGATLSHAILDRAEFRRVRLQGAVLEHSSFSKAFFLNANLSDASFMGASLGSAAFDGCDLTRASFVGVAFGSTNFRSLDLSKATGIAAADHYEPSSLDLGAIRQSRGRLPVDFLKGCGLTDAEIALSRIWDPDLSQERLTDLLYEVDRLIGTRPIQTHAVFISYSHADSLFADRLHHALDASGIRCWRDRHGLAAGPLEKQLDRAIRLNPVVIVVLSTHALESDWVEWEVSRARELERETKREVLCPVALDDSWKTSRWPGPLRQQLMKYHILDFQNWMSDADFGSALERLIHGLGVFYARK